MINEEDHLRIQMLRAGFQLKKAWTAINELDSALEERLDFAFSPDLGYLTACPTNLGTGMRASAMMHLPALVIAQPDGEGRPRREPARHGRARPLRRGLRRQRQHLPDLEPDDARRVRGGDPQAAVGASCSRSSSTSSTPAPASSRPTPASSSTRSAGPSASCRTATCSAPTRP